MKTIIDELHSDSYQALVELYNSNEVIGSESDEPVRLEKSTRVSPEEGHLLKLLCEKIGAIDTLEIGFAYGFSTIWLLDALRAKPGSSHIAIDPYQKTLWGGVGLAFVEKLKYQKNFQWIDDLSVHALSNLSRQHKQFDFIFIDGNHLFDLVLTDFYLSDMVLRPGGLIVFDDVWLPSVNKVTNFVFTNRSYKYLPTTVKNVAVFEKISNDTRTWDHFIPF
jgi:predicted O-methyltransferase YrrM